MLEAYKISKEILDVLANANKNIFTSYDCFLVEDAITKSNINVIWMCDPMHGNTQIDKYGKKFRSLQDAINETLETHRLLEQHRHFLSGIHLEISPRTDILECVSSTEELTENRVYDSAVDPRFNYHQVIFYLNQVIEKIKGDFY